MKKQKLNATTMKANFVSIENKRSFTTRTIAILSIFTIVFFASCEEDTLSPDTNPDSIVPKNFAVEIPKSISSNVELKTAEVDTLQGNDIYGHLRTFIHVGEFGAQLTQDIMRSIATNNLSRPLELTLISDDDGRPKHLVIVENEEFESSVWEYKLTYTDAGENRSEIGNTAMQVFWNTNPVEGIAILNPYNINRNGEEKFKNTNIRVKYSETGDLSFDRYMIVSVDEWPMPNPLVDPFGLSKLKMFVGKKGDIVSIYGNSEHPNAKFFNNETGFDWAFVAAAHESRDIAVAEVGLPPMDLDATERSVLLGDYAVKNVIEDQILDVWPNIDQNTLDAYLFHTQPPGYFNTNGFVQTGTAPSTDYEPLEANIQNLVPYNPYTILTMDIAFDE